MAHTNLQLTLTGNAGSLPAGLFTSVIQISNLMDGLNAVSLPVELLIRDQLPDDWRDHYFGHIEPRQNALSREQDDPDMDGFTNLEEYIADTNPLDPLSNFNPVSMTVMNGSAETPTGDDLRIELMNTKTSRVYDLLQVGALDSTNNWTPLSLDIPGTGDSLLINIPLDSSPSFYRGAVKLPQP